MIRARTCLAICLSLMVALSSAPSVGEVLHEQRSLYSTIIVKRTGNIICLQFSVRSDLRNQSCINQKKPQEMVFSYAKMAMTSLLFNPQPRHIAVIGLGGGTLPLAFAELFPEATIDAVEIDPAVVEVAEAYFGFAPTPRMTVHTTDARVWTKRALRKDIRYDIIVLDAFNGEYIPEHLMTREYLQESKDLMAPGGVLIANTFAISELYDHESATYAAVFGDFINFQVPESANRVVVYADKSVKDATLLDRARAFAPALQPFDVPIRRFAKILTKARSQRPDWRQDARVLTDQYSPANLLQGR